MPTERLPLVGEVSANLQMLNKKTPWSESASERPPLVGEVIANLYG
jgi:hypothetical protein